MRVQAIVQELQGEKIDIVEYSADAQKFVANALSPARVVRVFINEAEKAARAVVPDHQLSLAIGREGQNARLAARLTGWKIDIKSESQMAELALLEAQRMLEMRSLAQVVEESERAAAARAEAAVEEAEAPAVDAALWPRWRRPWKSPPSRRRASPARVSRSRRPKRLPSPRSPNWISRSPRTCTTSSRRGASAPSPRRPK